LEHNKSMPHLFYQISIIFIGLITSVSASVHPQMKSAVEAHVLRLGPGEDPKVVLMNYVRENKINSASVVSVVGSLKLAFIRYANQKEPVKIEGYREVVSLSGTLGATSGSHLHLSISDANGVTLGGHLAEGSKVYTTLEIVLQSYPDITFNRVLDPKTTFEELSVTRSDFSKP